MHDRPSSESRPIPRNVHIFGATSFLNDTASEMAYWVLPAFLGSLGAGPAQLGIIEGVAESVASAAKLFSGYLADRVSRRKPLVVGGYVVANAVKPLLALVSSWWQILGIRFADRFAKGIRGTTRDVMVAESIDSSRIGSAYGLVQAMDSAGAIVGPLAAVALIGHFGMRGVFAAAAVPGVLAILVAWIGIVETRRAGGQPQGDRPASAGAGKAPGLKPTSMRSANATAGNRAPSESSIRDDTGNLPPAERQSRMKANLPGGFYFVLTVVTLFSLGNSSDMFLVLRAQDVGIAGAHAPLLGLVFNITYTLLSWPAGKYSDRFSRSRLAAAGYCVFAMVYAVFALAPSQPAIWGAMAFYGLFYALTNPVLKALVVDTVAPEVRGRALGIYFFLTSLTTLLASVIAGELWKVYGAKVPFFLSSGIAVICAGLLLVRPETRRLH